MSLAWISLGALLVAIVLSCTTPVNVGVVSIVFAWVIGVYLGGMSLGDIVSGFPTQLFLTLVGVTLLFTMARVNGTLDRIAAQAVKLCRGNAGTIPIMFFIVSLALATIGPGNIATCALMAPMAMAVAGRAGIPAFLMAIMVGNGSNAGSLSPFAPTGVIVNGLMARIGIPGMEWQTYLNNLVAHAAVGFGGYFLLGGWRLFGRRYTGDLDDATGASAPFGVRNWITVAGLAAVITAVLLLKVNVGFVALACASLFALLRVADEKEAIRRMPWSVILMVSGVTVLIALLEKTQGMDLFSDLLARFSTRQSVTGMIALLTGLVSVYSSTSGVVIPAFLPTVPGIIERLGGGDPVAIASAINVGGHLVDVSSLSTLGALCLAAAPASEDTRLLFNKLLAWGLSMAFVGALWCWLVF